MMKQKTAEWLENTNPEYAAEYHERQFREIYRSTVAFCDWLEEVGYLRRDSKLNIMDLGSGLGANMYYMAQRYPECMFIGVDINPELVTRGNQFFQSRGTKNCHLEVGDIVNLGSKYTTRCDGIVSYQTLSWLPDFKEPIEAMTRLDASWIALTSLFYDGQVSCTIKAKLYDASLEQSTDYFYNVYSLPMVKKFLATKGYSDLQFAPFEIDIDLPKPNEKILGTYTERLENGRRLQISGPLLMPWHFIGSRK